LFAVYQIGNSSVKIYRRKADLNPQTCTAARTGVEALFRCFTNSHYYSATLPEDDEQHPRLIQSPFRRLLNSEIMISDFGEVLMVERYRVSIPSTKVYSDPGCRRKHTNRCSCPSTRPIPLPKCKNSSAIPVETRTNVPDKASCCHQSSLPARILTPGITISVTMIVRSQNFTFPEMSRHCLSNQCIFRRCDAPPLSSQCTVNSFR